MQLTCVALACMSWLAAAAAHPYPGGPGPAASVAGEPPPQPAFKQDAGEEPTPEALDVSESQVSEQRWEPAAEESAPEESPVSGRAIDDASLEGQATEVRSETISDFPHYYSPFRRRRTAAPAVDSVEDNPSHWRARALENKPPQFVTKGRARDPPPPAAQPPYTSRAVDSDLPSPKANEVDRAPYPSRYDPQATPYQQYRDDYGRGYGSDPAPPPPPPRSNGRRVIYYANLPEVVRPRTPDSSDRREYYGRGRDYDRYDLGRAANKYPRESRFEDPSGRAAPGVYDRDDYYRYRGGPPPPPAPGSYAIIDAERGPPPPPPGRGQIPYTPVRAYPQQPVSPGLPYPDTRYNRIPAPYQRTASPPPGPGQPYEQYRRPNSVPPSRLTVQAPLEPYRDYNPRQPAPWSMQIGTSLTVKDDGRAGAGPSGPYTPGRRFYVQSQDPYPPPTRYARVEDDPRHRL